MDKATAAAGIGLTKTITDAMAASASTMLGMDKIGIPEPRWVTDLNAMVDSAQLRAADQLLTWLQWAMNVDRPQVAWSGSAQCRGAGRRRAAQVIHRRIAVSGLSGIERFTA